MTVRGKLRAGAALFAVLFGLEAWAVHRLFAPRLRDLDDFPPIRLGRQQLVLVTAPVSGKPLLDQEGAADLSLAVETSLALLSRESRVIWRQRFGYEPPDAWGKIRLLSPPGSSSAPPCPTNLIVARAASSSGPVTLRLSHSTTPEGRQLSLFLTAQETALRIELGPVATPGSPSATGVGCQRLLRVGGDEKPFPISLSLRFFVARNSPLELTFSSAEPLTARPSSLLDLAQLPIDSLQLERRIAITSPGGKMWVTSLRAVDSDLLVTVDGSGFVSGRDAPSRWGWPLLPLILFVPGLLAAHAWLTTWLVRAHFRRDSRASRPLVFISYSHIDEEWKDRLVKHLGVIAAEGEIEIWDDRQISAGEEWLAAIDAALQRASVAVLLVSADFLTSPFIRSREVPSLLARRETGLRVIPLIVRPSAWEAVEWLAALQCRPRDARPLSQSRRHKAEESLAELAIEIRDLLRGSPRHSETPEDFRP